jgi:hypothetical protein
VRKTLVCTLVFFVLASSLVAQQNSAVKRKALVFTHVTVIDVTGGRNQPDRTVMILGAHMTEIGESAKIIVPKDSQIVAGTQWSALTGRLRVREEGISKGF